MSHFPEVDRIAAVARVWPQLFAQPPVGIQPLTIDDATLVVLCQTPNLVAFVDDRHDDLIASLNDALDGAPLVTAIHAVRATAIEIYLARELMALKVWLRDFDVGF